MTDQTKAILATVIDGDKSVSADERAAVFDILEGRSRATAADGKDRDWVMTRAEVAERFKCSPKSVSRYAQRGIIRPIRLGAKGRRASIGYSGKSVMAAIEEREREIA